MAVTSMSPSDIAASWATGMANAQTKIQAGVNAVKTAPGQAAAANKQGYLAGVQANVDKWGSRVSSVTLQQWQQDFITKGLPRIATGAQAAQPKMQAFMTQFLPFLTSTVGSLPPRGTFAQNVTRMTQMVTAAHGFSYKK